MRKADGWHLSLVVACEPHREQTGDLVGGLDWGVETFATLGHGPHDFAEIPHDRLLAQQQHAIMAAQRNLPRHPQGTKRAREGMAELDSREPRCAI